MSQAARRYKQYKIEFRSIDGIIYFQVNRGGTYVHYAQALFSIYYIILFNIALLSSNEFSG